MDARNKSKGMGVTQYLDDVSRYGGVSKDSAKYAELKTVYNNLESSVPTIGKDSELLAKYLPQESAESISL